MDIKKPYLVVETNGERRFPLTKAFSTRAEAVEYVNSSITQLNTKYDGESLNFYVDLIERPEDETDNEAYINIDPPYVYYDFYIIDLTETQR